ncbi:uncharacterized protein CCOS01_03634 [Colletotrichum costaricense]|uniref:Uncharacterized protein n=1 Tax=Colletotrichum costaricense TaxID=1209916 RepID=A0AAI9Z6S8_9PEZI|nr:uncharacterized protein CCOS01_03634 [Colletotrichum costaricense]KAK1534882.1 hypothetical protein CCOS01_03634 [Colletotrichum costaricense]
MVPSIHPNCILSDPLFLHVVSDEMPSLLSVLKHNASLSAREAGFVAVFAGATNGIGLATLKVLTVSLVSPRFYVIGRSKASFALHIAALRRSNPSVSIHFIETEIALLRNVIAVCENIIRREPHVDLLYMSPGSLAFGGPHLASYCNIVPGCS